MRTYQVLLTDDEEPALVGLENGIDWDGLRVEKVFKCHSKDSAIRMLEKNPIDIVVTDIEMPGGSGLELIRWVRENRPDIFCIFYTGHAEFTYAQEALRLGAADYLLKPIPYPQMEEILRSIEHRIELREKELDLKEIAEESMDTDAGEIVARVKKLVVENLSAGSLQRDDLAALVHVSPGYLSRIFKKEEGISLGDYITRIRIQMAKQLLRKTNLPISSIAERVGIAYSSYFTKVFKDNTGMTPQEYRQSRQ